MQYNGGRKGWGWCLLGIHPDPDDTEDEPWPIKHVVAAIRKTPDDINNHRIIDRSKRDGVSDSDLESDYKGDNDVNDDNDNSNEG